MEVDGRPSGTAKILQLEPVHSAEGGAILAKNVASVQETEDPVLGIDEVRLTDGVEPVMETVDAPAPLADKSTPEEENAWINTDTERVSEPGKRWSN
jgi:hypothetical protein